MKNMYTVLMCFASYYQFLWIHMIHLPILSHSHMSSMWLWINFVAENMVVTWCCGNRTVSKETYWVANNLMFVESCFCCSSCCSSFWQWVWCKVFAWLAACTALQYSPCYHSCWNVTNQNCKKAMRIPDKPHIWSHPSADLLQWHWALIWLTQCQWRNPERRGTKDQYQTTNMFTCFLRYIVIQRFHKTHLNSLNCPPNVTWPVKPKLGGSVMATGSLRLMRVLHNSE